MFSFILQSKKNSFKEVRVKQFVAAKKERDERVGSQITGSTIQLKKWQALERRNVNIT